jgi:hypothetical protein
MNLQNKYSRDEFLDFIKSFVPNFQKDIRKVNTRGLKATSEAFFLGENSDLDLAIFELTHTSSSDARVTLAAEGFRIMKDSANYRALIAYKSEKSDDWRLSLMTLKPEPSEIGRVLLNFSNPRRYSFYLGPDAKINTPYQFLIRKGEVENFEDLQSRFSVEVVTDKFYKEYRELFIRLVRHLQKDNAFQAFVNQNGIDTVNFAKKMLGQIVFLYFIQRKGWLGSKKGDLISNGDKNFLRSLFNNSRNKKENFFNQYLEPLFYNALNSKPDKAGSFYRNYFNCQIPFLNGGLFEPLENYNWDKEYLHIPDELFSSNPDKPAEGNGILDVFDSYNFTVYENDPVDKEVSIDPEMLGQIFEKLGAITFESFEEWAKAIESGNKTKEMKANKKLGVYYTPREIVHYMCRESLTAYLVASHSNISEESINRYLDYATALSVDLPELKKMWKGESYTPGQFKDIDDLLQNIKVVDPACGSGAFLIGMLQQIVRLRAFLLISADMHLIKQKSYYELKKETIQNCVYGVDIDPGAIEIAKLRLWLSLVVDHELEDIEPLPNLDYKIMQGNSLLENLVIGDSVINFNFNGSKKIDGRTKEMKNLFEEEQQTKLFYDASETLAEKLEKYHTEYFNVTNSENKKVLKKKIDDIENQLIKTKCEEEIARLKSMISNNSLDSKKLTKSTEQILTIKEKLNKWQKDKLRPFFPWRLHFSEVFNVNNGFDVVIANPPYNALLSNEEKKYYKETFESVKKGRQDTAAMFVELAKFIGKPDFQLAYILPYRLFSRKRNHGHFQIYVLNNFSIQRIIYLGANIGFSASDEFMILTMSGHFNTNNVILASFKPKLGKLNDREKYSSIHQNYFNESGEINLNVIRFDRELLTNIKNDSIELATICHIKDGIVPFIRNKLLSKTKKDNRYVKFAGVAGKYTLERFHFSYNELYLCYDINEAKKYIKDVSELRKVQLRQKEIFLRRKILTAQNSSVLKGAIDENKTFVSNSLHSTFLRKEYVDQFSLEYLLALLNSKVLNYYHDSLRLKGTDLHPQILIRDLKRLPIKRSSENQQNLFVEAVNKILAITKSTDYLDNPGKHALVTEYEKQIDQMVYKLYNLSDKDIEIIEKNTK